MRYEILDDNGNVINTIIADLQFVEVNYPGQFREVPELPQRIVQLTKLEFLNRFTDEELANILETAKTNSLIAVWIKKLELAGDIRLDDQRTIDGVGGLEQLGILAAGRAAQILA